MLPGLGCSVQRGKRWISTCAKTKALMSVVAAEEEPRLLGTVENRLGMADWLKKEGHE